MSLSGLDTLSPVNFKYLHDSNFVLNQNTFTTQQGLSLNLVNALSSCNDATVQNYSNIFLSDTIKSNDFGYVKLKQQLVLSFPTYLALSAFPDISSGTLYTTISSSPALSSRITFSRSLSDSLNTYFSFIDIDGVKCRISTIDTNNTKSLTVDTNTLSCYFATSTAGISASGADLFEYSLDGKGFLKLFFRTPNNRFYIIRKNGDTLSAVDAQIYGSLNSDIFATTYKTRQNVVLLNNYIYYDKHNIEDFKVNDTATIRDIPQNHLVYYNYESDLNFASGADVYVDFYKAKNVLSNDYYINDKLPFNPSVVQRKYTTILSKQNSETYNGDLQLNYNYYTKDYNFVADKTTKFVMPETLYPYKSINIDDSGLVNNGSYGGLTPVFSDKVYKDLNSNTNVVNYNEANGSYLCTWLYTDTAQLTSYWVDRYYFPKRITTNVAFSGTPNQIYTYTNAVSTYLNSNYPNSIVNYYDLRSSLTFEPSSTYLYSRIGNKYINKVVDTYPVAANTFTTYRFNSYETSNNDSITFDKNYGSFNLTPTNNDNSFTLSFDLITPNLSSINCSVIIGNNFDEGITIYKGGVNNIYTPGFFLITPTEITFCDKNYNHVFNLNLSAYIGAPYKILDIVNYGFDHKLKVLYYNLSNNYPGLLDFSIHNEIHSKVEFPTLVNIFADGILGKTYYNNTYVYYRYLAVNNNLVKFDYVNNALISNDVSSGLIVNGSVVSYNNNLVYLSGYRGVIVGDYGVSKIKDTVYFKNLSTNEEYATLSSYGDLVYDIIEYNNNLLVQTKQQVTMYDSLKRVVGTFATNTSAVSGFKIDVINDNYKPKLLSFFRTVSGRIGVAKYDMVDLQIESSSATSLSTYDMYYQEIINPTANTNALYFTPVNFSDISKVNKFGQGDIVIRTDLFSGNDYLNKTVSIVPATISRRTNQNLTLSFDSYQGQILLYNNGEIIKNISLSATGINQFIGSYYLNNTFGVGMPFIENRPSSQILDYDYASNFEISNFKVFGRTLSQDEVKFNYLKNSKIDSINFDVPCGTRNNTDTAISYNRYAIPGRKNNNVKIYIKNLDFSEYNQSILTSQIKTKLNSILPLNTDNVELIYINNE